MPGFDGTGPMGIGSRTGGGFGFCPPGAVPVPDRGAYPYFGVGRGGYPRGGGRGRAWGGGRGWSWRAYARPPYPASGAPYPPAPYYDPSSGEELDFLRDQAKGLQEDLDSIRDRIGELEKEPKPAQE
ncbi:MAG: DUF5320 domain-containing protein [PVC group bacterium]